MKSKLIKIIACLILFACTSQLQFEKTETEKAIDIVDESYIYSVATHIFEAEGILGFLITDANFCQIGTEYYFESFNIDGQMMESGYYYGIGRVPYMVQIEVDANYVIIYRK